MIVYDLANGIALADTRQHALKYPLRIRIRNGIQLNSRREEDRIGQLIKAIQSSK
ncbi:MAG: hypothetical protein PVH53_13025 [Desulfobacterales bacterium]